MWPLDEHMVIHQGGRGGSKFLNLLLLNSCVLCWGSPLPELNWKPEATVPIAVVLRVVHRAEWRTVESELKKQMEAIQRC